MRGGSFRTRSISRPISLICFLAKIPNRLQFSGSAVVGAQGVVLRDMNTRVDARDMT